jgi:mono/diheme cytochrome c family protein
MYELVRDKWRKSSRSAMSRAIAAAIAILGCSAAAAAAAQPSPSPPISAQAVIQRACVGCHELAVAAGKGRTPQEWSDTIDRMTDRGVDASDAEIAAVKAYLAKALPPGTEGPPKAMAASQ